MPGIPKQNYLLENSDPTRWELGRRTFLRNALIAAGGLAVTGDFLAPRAFAQRGPRRLSPVRVSRDRIIREIVGLRPFRPEGFVVDAQRTGAKLLIHNYGHGGAGITLSWGTASQAVDLLRDFPLPTPRGRRSTGPRRFAVLGCGVNGLSTAITLQRRYQDGPGTVTIYAKDLPPNTTSNIAGGWWMPTSLYDSASVAPQFLERFRASARYSNRAFQLLMGHEYGVRWIDSLEFHQTKQNRVTEFP